uniref:Putative bifunctional DNA primase/polymerase n=1 Tax=viral metagenome TaxID=1070528 RepID=A0A6M3L5W4_9ZZZZ
MNPLNQSSEEGPLQQKKITPKEILLQEQRSENIEKHAEKLIKEKRPKKKPKVYVKEVDHRLEAALLYAKAFLWPIIALHTIVDGQCTCRQGVKCNSPGKHPRWHPQLLPNGVHSATTDEQTIRKWWSLWPYANVGIATGKQSFDVIDIDFSIEEESAIGEESLIKIQKKRKFKLPRTVEQLTGGGGRQLFFKYGGMLKNSVKFAPGLDVRSNGGYIVAPPSIHITGRAYEWEVDHHPADTEIAHVSQELINEVMEIEKFLPSTMPITQALPEKLPDIKTNQAPKQSKNPDGWVMEALFGVKKGSRNETTAKLAGYYLRKFQGDTVQTFLILDSWNNRNIPPLDENEIHKIIESISKRQGRDELSNAIGSGGGEFQKIEILEYPDGSKEYRVFFKPSESEDIKTVQMNIKDLGQFSLFKFKFAEVANCFPSPVKQVEWEKMVNKALAEAEHIPMTMDEVKLDIVRGAIESQLEESMKMSDVAYINNRIIVCGDNGNEAIAVKLKTIMNMTRTENEKLTRKELGIFLRSMGFVNSPLYIAGRSVRCWHTPLTKWKDRFSD